jgi:hypothetical protein
MEISFNNQDLSDIDREHKIKTHRVVKNMKQKLKILKIKLLNF